VSQKLSNESMTSSKLWMDRILSIGRVSCGKEAWKTCGAT